MSRHVVEVNETRIHTYGNNIDAASKWWLWFRRANPADRFHETAVSITGAMVEVACDSKEDAEWLARHMVAFGGLDKAAVKVKRLAEATP